MSQLLKDLIAAKAIITPPERWTRHAYARDHRGEATDPCDPEATCWCAYGALHKVTNTEGTEVDHDSERYAAAVFVLEQASAYAFQRVPDVVNDRSEYGHTAILTVYDRAIELAKAEG